MPFLMEFYGTPVETVFFNGRALSRCVIIVDQKCFFCRTIVTFVFLSHIMGKQFTVIGAGILQLYVLFCNTAVKFSDL